MGLRWAGTFIATIPHHRHIFLRNLVLRFFRCRRSKYWLPTSAGPRCGLVAVPFVLLVVRSGPAPYFTRTCKYFMVERKWHLRIYRSGIPTATITDRNRIDTRIIHKCTAASALCECISISSAAHTLPKRKAALSDCRSAVRSALRGAAVGG